MVCSMAHSCQTKVTAEEGTEDRGIEEAEIWMSQLGEMHDSEVKEQAT